MKRHKTARLAGVPLLSRRCPAGVPRETAKKPNVSAALEWVSRQLSRRPTEYSEDVLAAVPATVPATVPVSRRKGAVGVPR